MISLNNVLINNGNVLKLWFEVEESRELTEISPDTSGPYTEDDKTGERFATIVTGEQVRLSPLISYSPIGSPVVFTFSSDNPTEIDVLPDGNVVFMVEPESTSSANITITANSGNESATRSFNITLTVSGAGVVEVIEGGVAGSARKALSDPLDNLLVGANPSTQSLVYTSQNHATVTYIRNTDFLLWSTHAEALTCASPWNSRSGSRRAGTAITPRHAVLAAHYPLYAGDSLRFITSDNTVITRNVVSTSVIFREGVNTDAMLVLLDSDLPSSITPCKIFPANYEVYLPAGGTTRAGEDLPLFSFDQSERGSVRSLRGASRNQSFIVNFREPKLPNRLAFYDSAISGDSGNPIFAVTNSELWLLSTYWSAASGPFYGGLVAELNDAILSLDTLQGDLTGYTVTEGNLSAYPTY
jgi:hypothetical protein